MMSDFSLLDYAVSDEVFFTADPYVIKYFTKGQCNALAWEIYKLTGWQLGMLSDIPVGTDPDYFGHLFVVDPTAMVVDIRGRMHLSNFKEFWPMLPFIHLFESAESYELEMMLWENDTHYTADTYAREWAEYIVDVLNN
jgi:hypothetical protein